VIKITRVRFCDDVGKEHQIARDNSETIERAKPKEKNESMRTIIKDDVVSIADCQVLNSPKHDDEY